MATKTIYYLSCFYWLVALSYLSVGGFSNYSLLALHKALPIVFLAVISLLLCKGHTRLWLFMALIASSCGDILLASNLAQGFIYGLSAFALAHLCYCICFLPWFSWSKQPLKYVAILAVLLVAVLIKVVPNTENLLVPVVIYMSIITLMALLAFFAQPSCYFLSVGALFFILSDSLIALNKFVFTLPYEHFLVMGTYYLAQYCLFYACIKRCKQHATQ